MNSGMATDSCKAMSDVSMGCQRSADLDLKDQEPGRAPCNFEDVISAMGRPGPYQITRCILLSLFSIPLVFINMNFVFIGLQPAFSCSSVNEDFLFQENKTYVTNIINTTTTTTTTMIEPYRVLYDECAIRVVSNTSSGPPNTIVTFGCMSYRYNGGKQVSVTTEWDLVCDKNGMAEMTQTVMALGWFLGLLVASTMSDKFGRKKTIIMAGVLSSISELNCAFAPNIYVMIGLRFCSGFFGAGISAVLYVICAEMLVSKDRETFGVYIGVLWSCCSILLCGIAYIFRENSWRDLQLCLAISGVIPILFVWFVDESASWLYSEGDYGKATRIVQKMCTVNTIDFDKVGVIWSDLCVKGVNRYTHEGNENKQARDYNVCDLLKNGKIRTSVLIAWFACFTNDAAYFGMFLSASTLSGDIYLNAVLMAVLELPGCVWMMFMLKYKGRRFVIVFFMVMGAICLSISTCFSLFIIPNYTPHLAYTYTSTTFYLLGRLAISNSFTSMYVYIPELFPTTLRSSAMGIALSGGCLGGMLSPYLVPLHRSLPWAPGACLVGALTVTSLLFLKLPETKGKQLLSCIEWEV